MHIAPATLLMNIIIEYTVEVFGTAFVKQYITKPVYNTLLIKIVKILGLLINLLILLFYFIFI